MSKVLKRKEDIVYPINKAFKIPSWHELYSEYFRYLKNTQETIEILTEFRKEQGIESELVMTGTDERTGKIFLEIGTIKDVNRIKHDKAKFGTNLLRPNSRGMYPVRKNGPLHAKWVAKLLEHDNFKVLPEPSVTQYIAFDKKGKDLGEYVKNFVISKDNSLYMMISSETEFIVTEDFIEVEPYKFIEIKEGKD